MFLGHHSFLIHWLLRGCYGRACWVTIWARQRLWWIVGNGSCRNDSLLDLPHVLWFVDWLKWTLFALQAGSHIHRNINGIEKGFYFTKLERVISPCCVSDFVRVLVSNF